MAEIEPPTFGAAVSLSMGASPAMALHEWAAGTPEGRLIYAAKALNDEKLLAWVMAAPMGSAAC